LNLLGGLAFNSAGDLFVAEDSSGNIYRFTPSGVKSTFASGLDFPDGLAFQPVPEPSGWKMLGMGALALFGLRRKRCFLRQGVAHRPKKREMTPPNKRPGPLSRALLNTLTKTPATISFSL